MLNRRGFSETDQDTLIMQLTLFYTWEEAKETLQVY